MRTSAVETSAWTPIRCTGSACIPCRQWDARLETFQFDACAGASSQQAVRRLPKDCATFDGVTRQSGIEGRKEDRNVAIDPFAQRSINEGTPLSYSVRFGDGAGSSAIIRRRMQRGILTSEVRYQPFLQVIRRRDRRRVGQIGIAPVMVRGFRPLSTIVR
jgi:hypothetical protein